ncbi:hypothetical protein ACFSO7_11695 [Bacillus sp. CGMCC 1.16607]|uniref:hypothetical protein n=1 Tax=Bacillus sp. CGMCC 1.16607 TaxID=3351842 RepID=UPI0036377C31
MINYVCKTCGVQYEASILPPVICKICSDDRQYVPQSGQDWIDLNGLLETGHYNEFIQIEEGLYAIQTKPQVGIGQRAYLVTTPEGNILWDCITYIDQLTIDKINGLGGLKGIAISHPHYYSTITVWADAFECPIYIHEADREWIARESLNYHFWNGETIQLNSEVSLINLGGHFKGSSVLHWNYGSNSKGTLLVGDTIFIVPDPGWVSFLYSHPNRIPLPTSEVKKIRQIVDKYDFNSIYGAFEYYIENEGKEAIIKSADRYIYHIER